MPRFQIELVEFVRPFGRTKATPLMLKSKYEKKYNEIKQTGARLGFEVLGSRGEVYVFLEDPNLGDYSAGIISDVSKIEETIMEFIEQFEIAEYEDWKRKMED